MKPLAVVLALLLAACSSGGRHTSSDPASSSVPSSTRQSTTTTTLPDVRTSLNCRDVIFSEDTPSPGFSVVFNRVALPTGKSLGAVRLRGGQQSGKFWAKQGLEIRPGASFELIVPTAWVGRLRIGWGNPATPTGHLVVSGCQTTKPGAHWLAFAGGYWVNQPACVPLIVKTAERQQLVHIGIGTACPE